MKHPMQAKVERATWWRAHLRNRCRHGILFDGRRVMISEVQRVVCDYFSLPYYEMTSKNRDPAVVRPRQIAMYLSRQLTKRSLPFIGERFGGKDHSTVSHACNRIAELVDSDEETARQVDVISHRIMISDGTAQA